MQKLETQGGDRIIVAALSAFSKGEKTMRKQVLLCFLLFLAAALLSGCQRKRLAQDAVLESFLYETAGMAMGSETSFSIVREGDGYAVTQSSGGGHTVRTAHVGRENAMQATDILREYNALSWDGYAKYDPRVLDGTTFILSVAFDDGTTISAQGANNYPKGLSAAVGEIKNLFDQFLREPEQ